MGSLERKTSNNPAERVLKILPFIEKAKDSLNDEKCIKRLEILARLRISWKIPPPRRPNESCDIFELPERKWFYRQMYGRIDMSKKQMN